MTEADAGHGDPSFDRYARMVCRALGVRRQQLVTIIEPDRAVFPGACGLPEDLQRDRESPLSHSFCKHVVIEQGPLIIRDAREDDRLRDNLAISDLGLISYAGWPITDHTGDDRRLALRSRRRAPGLDRQPDRDARGPGGRLLGRDRSTRAARARGARRERCPGPLPPQPGAARAERGPLVHPDHERRGAGRREDRRRPARLPARRDLAPQLRRPHRSRSRHRGADLRRAAGDRRGSRRCATPCCPWTTPIPWAARLCTATRSTSAARTSRTRSTPISTPCGRSATRGRSSR